MTTILLVTRPEYDYTTRYISAWAEEVLTYARAQRHIVFDLRKTRARRKEFEGMLRKRHPSLVFLNGHGDEQTVAGQNDEMLVEAGTNETLLQNTVVYALSCRSAKVLGAECVKRGTLAYLGYTEDFIFLYSADKRTRPLEDKTASLFLDPSNQIPLTLLKGHTVQDAHARAKTTFARNIQKLLTSQTSSDDTAVVRYLWWDMQHLTYHGDANATLETRTRRKFD
jgi:hypothetical protein